jgi:hypothetical protein
MRERITGLSENVPFKLIEGVIDPAGLPRLGRKEKLATIAGA